MSKVAQAFMGRKKYRRFAPEAAGVAKPASGAVSNIGVAQPSAQDDDAATEDLEQAPNLGPAKKKARQAIIKTSKVKF